jgi:hypothetical protein
VAATARKELHLRFRLPLVGLKAQRKLAKGLDRSRSLFKLRWDGLCRMIGRPWALHFKGSRGGGLPPSPCSTLREVRPNMIARTRGDPRRVTFGHKPVGCMVASRTDCQRGEHVVASSVITFLSRCKRTKCRRDEPDSLQCISTLRLGHQAEHANATAAGLITTKAQGHKGDRRKGTL